MTSIRFLGSGDAFGSGGRLQSCIYVDAGSERFLIDCGASSLSAMRRWNVDPGEIDTILLTHLHGDHFGGLPFFLLDAELVTKRIRPLVIAGPPGMAEQIRQAQEVFFPGSSTVQLKFPVSYIEWVQGLPLQNGGLAITPYEVVHASGAPAYALRISCTDKVIACSGDSEWTDALIDAARGVDLFICEAYTFDKKVKYHLDYQTLMAKRAALGCRRLVLTHMNAAMLERLSEVELETACDGYQIIL